MARALSRCAPALVLGVVAACSPPRLEPLPPPTTRPLVTTTTVTTVADRSGVELGAVSGRTTTTTVSVAGGGATLTGAVLAAEGPVAGAVVRAERLVGTAAAAVEVLTGPDGRWAVAGVRGGSYRVRAWRAPDLALVQPALLYLAATETRVVDLSLERHGGTAASGVVSPNPPVVGDPANLVVQVTRRSVDGRGVVRGTLLPGVPVVLTGNGAMEVRSANPTVTDGAGRGRWTLRCRGPGPAGLSVGVGSDAAPLPLALPDCAP